jgi:hypothetical protein
MNMAMDSEEITVHQMDAVHRRGPVFYAALTRDAETCKHLLTSTLWNHHMAVESPLRHHGQSSSGAAFPIRVVCGPLGRPHLLVGECKGPAISFSSGGGKVWAALCGDDSDIGIDVAGSDEFQGEYPFHRVFHAEELEHALILADGELQQASALLWSIKEAVVKALGCAFHLVEPRHINVYPAAGDVAGGGDGYTFPVALTGKAKERFPMAAGSALLVRSLPQGKMWLSIALLDRSLEGHE